MKTIYQKIITILFLGFLCQMLLFGIFYKHVVTTRVIAEVNYQENQCQAIMENIIDQIQNNITPPEECIKIIQQYSQKYNATFVIKDNEGFTIFSSKSPKKLNATIEKVDYIKTSGKITYIVHGYFPARVSNPDFNLKGSTGRIVMVFVIILLSIITLVLIYKSIANPLKKLSKAVNSIDYGKTLVKIPYYSDDELGLLCRNFEEMGVRLKKSENNQRELIQAISHDIKTPLTSIMGYSKRLVEGKVKDSRKDEYFQIIYRKANDLKSLLEELEDYSNINVENKYVDKNTNICEFFKELCCEFESEPANKVRVFTYHNELDPCTNVLLDKKKIKRIFFNLVENSLKYAGEDCTIILRALNDKKSIIFEISDNGCGVPNEQLDKIFDRFYRVESSRSREKGGTGLGLAICKEIVEHYNGTIEAKNLPGGGLLIRIICNFKTYEKS